MPDQDSKNQTNRQDTNNKIVDIVQQKKKLKRPGRTEELVPHCAPGEMSTLISQAMDLSSFGPVDTNSPAQVEQRIQDYFQYCIQNDIRPSAEGMALSLNTNRTTLWRWREGSESNKPEGVRNAIKKGYSLLNYLLTQLMQDGHINPVSGIFLLKNNYQYFDKSEVIVTPNNPLDSTDPETTRRKYIQALPEDTE